jgi:signal transduction histidine kinase
MKEQQRWHIHSDELAPPSNQRVMRQEIEIPHRRVTIGDVLLTAPHGETEFVKAMTHEVRTPLNVIIGLCQLLERDRKTPLTRNQRDAVNRMDRNARSLLQTVNHLLTCVRTGDYK